MPVTRAYVSSYQGTCSERLRYSVGNKRRTGSAFDVLDCGGRKLLSSLSLSRRLSRDVDTRNYRAADPKDSGANGVV